MQVQPAQPTRVGNSVDLRSGFDLNSRTGQRKAMKIIEEQEPTVSWMAPKCGPWSLLQNANPQQYVEELRKNKLHQSGSVPTTERSLFCH